MIANGVGYRSGERKAVPPAAAAAALNTWQLLSAGVTLANSFVVLIVLYGLVSFAADLRAQREALDVQRASEVSKAQELEKAQQRLGKQVADLLLQTKGK